METTGFKPSLGELAKQTLFEIIYIKMTFVISTDDKGLYIPLILLGRLTSLSIVIEKRMKFIFSSLFLFLVLAQAAYSVFVSQTEYREVEQFTRHII